VTTATGKAGQRRRSARTKAARPAAGICESVVPQDDGLGRHRRDPDVGGEPRGRGQLDAWCQPALLDRVAQGLVTTAGAMAEASGMQ
jgi:hypothetical protein